MGMLASRPMRGGRIANSDTEGKSELLSIQPGELKFPFQLKKHISCSVRIRNETVNYVAFKVKTTAPTNYCVRPVSGVLLPYQKLNIKVTKRAQNEAPPDMHCKDKFLIQSVIAESGTTTKDITSELFEKRAGTRVAETKLRVSYVTPPQPAASITESRSQSTYCSDAWSKASFLSTDNTVTEKIGATDGERHRSIVQTRELEFPFELGKQLSCPLRLVNTTNNCVAYKVKATVPNKYAVRPNMGLLPPRSSHNINVRMQAQSEAPRNMQCADKFLVQSTVVPYVMTPEDVTSKMFNDKTGKGIAETKLRVSLIAPVSPQPDRSISESSPTSYHDPDDTATSFVSTSAPVAEGVKPGRTGHRSIVQTGELKFPFELRKRISCPLRLANSTDNYVAYKVKTSAPKKYTVTPTVGLLLPHSDVSVTVTMQAQTEAPLDMKCTDKFMIQSTISPYQITDQDYLSRLFKDGRETEEAKLRVFYVVPPFPSISRLLRTSEDTHLTFVDG